MRRARGSSVVAGAVAAALVAVAAAGAEPQHAGRPPRRPERTAADRLAAAQRLRAAYRRPPATWPAPHIDPGVAWRELGLLPQVAHPGHNPHNAAKAELGRLLFHDHRLSRAGTLACVSCHAPEHGWADGGTPGRSPARGPRRDTPTIRNAAFQPSLFWDGRVDSLERQAEEALVEVDAMAADPGRVVELLGRSPGYRERFERAFPGRPIEFRAVAEALACFERTVVGGRSRFDAFLRGDVDALTDAEVLGLDLFRREARCLNCHHGPTFSDGRFHDLGLSFYGRPQEDVGRYAVTRDAADVGRFRTPSLRDVTRTGPLAHAGMFQLSGMLRMYDAGMATLRPQPYQRQDPLFPRKSPLLKPLGLNGQDLADLAAFLGSLEEPPDAEPPPRLPEIEASAVSAVD